MNSNVVPANPNTYRNNMIGILNHYLANLAMTITNLYNFHWNVTDPLFILIHEKTEEYYTRLQAFYDEIAERIKMLNGHPLTTLDQYIHHSVVKNYESRNYNAQAIIREIISNFEILLSIAQEIGNMATGVNDMNTIDIITNHISFFEKQLWMLKAQLLN
ncbi:MAG: Dps family protein [Bacilli bacterium]|jgi:starvation-inducible DNA-binding protein